MEEEWGQLTGLRGDLKNGKVGEREIERWSEENIEIYSQRNSTTQGLHFIFYVHQYTSKIKVKVRK